MANPTFCTASTFDVFGGEVVTLLGRNGAGKTTTLKSIMGIVGARTGSVRYEASELIGLASDRIARLGIALCPEERGIFAEPRASRRTCCCRPRCCPAVSRSSASSICFPTSRSACRSQGTKLSGGEQQMLAIGRILRTGARLLLLDEPTEGLAPVIIQQIGKTIGMLKQQGFTILLVEQNFRLAATIADRYYVMEHGRIIDALRQCRTRGQSRQASRLSRVFEVEAQYDEQGEIAMRRLIGYAALHGCARMRCGPRAIFRRHDQDRRAQRHVGPLFRPVRARVRSRPPAWRSRISAPPPRA